MCIILKTTVQLLLSKIFWYSAGVSGVVQHLKFYRVEEKDHMGDALKQ